MKRVYEGKAVFLLNFNDFPRAFIDFRNFQVSVIHWAKKVSVFFCGDQKKHQNLELKISGNLRNWCTHFFPCTVPCLNQHRTWKWMVGILVSFWEGLSSGAEHGTWKSTPGKGGSYWKPSFWVAMVLQGGQLLPKDSQFLVDLDHSSPQIGDKPLLFLRMSNHNVATFICLTFNNRQIHTNPYKSDLPKIPTNNSNHYKIIVI